MRILRVLTRLNLGGPARQVLASDPLLVARGHTVRILAGSPEAGEGDLFDVLVERGLDVVRVPKLTRGIALARDLLARGRIRKEIEAFEPDVVHTHASKAGFLGRAAVEASRASERIARVHTFHGHVLEGYFPELVTRRLIAEERRLAARTDRVVAVSHATADDLVRLEVVDERRLVVVQPGVVLDAFLALDRGRERAKDGALRTLIGAAAGDFVVGVVGRLAEVKRPTLALDVHTMLARKHPDLHLAFVGDGGERRGLERAIRALDGAAGSRVHLLGARVDMPAVLDELDAVLLTSRSEGMPVSLIEAGAAALPVVATSVGGVPELVVHERTGFLGETVEELAFGLDRLVGDRAEARAMGERARMRVEREHGAERLAQRLEDIYEVVLRERGSRGETSGG